MPAPRRIRYVKTSAAHSRLTNHTVRLDGIIVGTVGTDINGAWRWTPTTNAPGQSDSADKEANPSDWEATRRDATVSLLADAGLERGVAWSVVLDDLSEDEEPYVQTFLAALRQPSTTTEQTADPVTASPITT